MVKLMTATEAAARLRIGLRSFHRLTAEHGWPTHVKVGRKVLVKDRDLQRWLEQITAKKETGVIG